MRRPRRQMHPVRRRSARWTPPSTTSRHSSRTARSTGRSATTGASVEDALAEPTQPGISRTSDPLSSHVHTPPRAQGQPPPAEKCERDGAAGPSLTEGGWPRTRMLGVRSGGSTPPCAARLELRRTKIGRNCVVEGAGWWRARVLHHSRGRGAWSMKCGTCIDSRPRTPPRSSLHTGQLEGEVGFGRYPYTAIGRGVAARPGSLLVFRHSFKCGPWEGSRDPLSVCWPHNSPKRT